MKVHIFRFGCLGAGLTYLHFYKEKRPEVFLEVKRRLEVQGPHVKSSAVTNLLSQVTTDLNLNEEFKSKIKPFISSTIDAIHLGSPKCDDCVYLGIPQLFFLFHPENRNSLSVSVNNKLLDSKEIDSYSLSAEAKKFAIASEIVKSERIPYSLAYFITMTTISQGTTLSFIGSVLQFKKKLQLAYPLMFHLSLYLFSFVLWCALGSVILAREEVSVDLTVGGLSESYRKGGIEYYSKVKDAYGFALKAIGRGHGVDKHDGITWMPYMLTIDKRIKHLEQFDPQNKFANFLKF